MKRCAATLPFLLILSSNALAQRKTVECPTIPGTAADAGLVASPDTQPARCFFCGKLNKHKDDGTISNCTAGSPCPYVWPDQSNPNYLKCGNLIDPAPGGTATLMGTPALESAEIRGWLTHLGKFHWGETEWEMDIILDIGWMPNPDAPVTPLNTIDAIAQWVAPLNIAAFGYPKNDTYPYPQPPASNSFDAHGAGSMLGGSTATFGGNYAAVVHIEVDGWGADDRGICD